MLFRSPLLQQSTRPDSWQLWFSALNVEAPYALAGPRFEQFSMTTAAAVCGMGVALIPRLLIEAELARGELVQAHPSVLPVERHYYLVLPEGSDDKASLQRFASWLQEAARH